MQRVSVTSVVFTLVSAALAQPCVPAFQPGEPGSSGISDPFSAYIQPMKFFDGNLFVGGSFSSAGTVAANAVAAFDPSTETWSALGGGINPGSTNSFVAALEPYRTPTGYRLYVGGLSSHVVNGGLAVPNTASLAAWDGAAWSAVGTGWTASNRGSVWTLLDWERTPGVQRLVAGGGWPSIGGASADGIAVYDGSTWSNIGGTGDTGIAGPFSPVVFASAVYQNQLYIGGRFASVNGIAAPLVARFTSSVWQRPGALAAAGSVSDISAFVVFDSGVGPRLFAGGYDMRVGGQSTSIAAWNGTTWARVGQNLGGRCTSLAAFDDGSGTRLYCGLTADARENYFYRLEGNTWVPVGGGMSVALTGNFPSVFGLLEHEGSLFVGGNFQIAGTVPSYGLARYATGTADCIGDVDCDGDDDSDDIIAFFAAWDAGGSGGDVDDDGDTDSDDVVIFFRAWDAGC